MPISVDWDMVTVLELVNLQGDFYIDGDKKTIEFS